MNLSVPLVVGMHCLVDVSDFFSVRGGGRRSPRRQGRVGDRFFTETPRRVGFSRRRGRGREGVCSEFGNLGAGAKYFFQGRNATKIVCFHHHPWIPLYPGLTKCCLPVRFLTRKSTKKGKVKKWEP